MSVVTCLPHLFGRTGTNRSLTKGICAVFSGLYVWGISETIAASPVSPDNTEFKNATLSAGSLQNLQGNKLQIKTPPESAVYFTNSANTLRLCFGARISAEEILTSETCRHILTDQTEAGYSVRVYSSTHQYYGFLKTNPDYDTELEVASEPGNEAVSKVFLIQTDDQTNAQWPHRVIHETTLLYSPFDSDRGSLVEISHCEDRHCYTLSTRTLTDGEPLFKGRDLVCLASDIPGRCNPVAIRRNKRNTGHNDHKSNQDNKTCDGYYTKDEYVSAMILNTALTCFITATIAAITVGLTYCVYKRASQPPARRLVLAVLTHKLLTQSTTDDDSQSNYNQPPANPAPYSDYQQ